MMSCSLHTHTQVFCVCPRNQVAVSRVELLLWLALQLLNCFRVVVVFFAERDVGIIGEGERRRGGWGFANKSLGWFHRGLGGVGGGTLGSRCVFGEQDERLRWVFPGGALGFAGKLTSWSIWLRRCVRARMLVPSAQINVWLHS